MDQPEDNIAAGFQLILLLTFVVTAILFMLTQQNMLKTIRTDNRSMTPGQVWRQLIPLYGLYWQFIVVEKIARSIQRQLLTQVDDSILGYADASAVEAAGRPPTQGIGKAYCALIVIGIVVNFLGPNFAAVSGLFSLSGIVCWIIYWVRLAQYKNKLV